MIYVRSLFRRRIFGHLKQARDGKGKAREYLFIYIYICVCVYVYMYIEMVRLSLLYIYTSSRLPCHSCESQHQPRRNTKDVIGCKDEWRQQKSHMGVGHNTPYVEMVASLVRFPERERADSASWRGESYIVVGRIGN